MDRQRSGELVDLEVLQTPGLDRRSTICAGVVRPCAARTSTNVISGTPGREHSTPSDLARHREKARAWRRRPRRCCEDGVFPGLLTDRFRSSERRRHYLVGVVRPCAACFTRHVRERYLRNAPGDENIQRLVIWRVTGKTARVASATAKMPRIWWAGEFPAAQTNQGPYSFTFRFVAKRGKHPANQISVNHSIDHSHQGLQPLRSGGDWV